MATGFRFTSFTPSPQSPFDRLFAVFKELIVHTSGDFDEAIDWLKELDKEYKLTTKDYSIDDFIEDLKKKGFIREEFKNNGKGGDGKDGERNGRGGIGLTEKLERILRQSALEQIFGNLKKRGNGNHRSPAQGKGDEHTGDLREFRFGDGLEQVVMSESLRNAQISSGGGDFTIQEKDLVVEDTYHQSQMSTVLMIDISHSMILYGEDRITPAKKVAMAMAELIRTRYPKDTIDIIVFGNDAWPVQLKDLPYLQVGPYHTNTIAGLELAMDILRRKKNTNKQIFMITDGKPSCLKQADGNYYFNSVGLDPMIVEKCCNAAQVARRLHIDITTFMIASDPYLQRFVQAFTDANKGKAFYTGLQGLGEMVFEDYKKNRRKRL